jgi:hypothetical protein
MQLHTRKDCKKLEFPEGSLSVILWISENIAEYVKIIFVSGSAFSSAQVN